MKKNIYIKVKTKKALKEVIKAFESIGLIEGNVSTIGKVVAVSTSFNCGCYTLLNESMLNGKLISWADGRKETTLDEFLENKKQYALMVSKCGI